MVQPESHQARQLGSALAHAWQAVEYWKDSSRCGFTKPYPGMQALHRLPSSHVEQLAMLHGTQVLLAASTR